LPTPSVLFVDDEVNVTSGLKRLLHKYKNEWDFNFVNSAKDALLALETKSYACIVTDMKMPEMSGDELIKVIHEKHPSVARIILSGHSGLEAIMKALPISHQFLSKPCEPEKLINSIQRAVTLENTTSNNSIVEKLKELKSLPVRPEVFDKLTKLISSDDYSIMNIVEIISTEPAITSKLLQIVNSAYFSLPREISDVQEAINYLGIETVKTTALAIELYESFYSKDFFDYDLEKDCRKCIEVASFLKSHTEDKMQSEILYTAAILQNAGRLVVLSYFPEQYKEIINLIENDKDPLEAELEVLGSTSKQLASSLILMWGLPYQIASCIAHADDPWNYSKEDTNLSIDLYIANYLHKISSWQTHDYSYKPNLDYFEQDCISKRYEYLNTLKNNGVA
jgi:HD-like signal output (HDOD) protein